MTANLISKIIRYGVVDTRKYRYVLVTGADAQRQWAEIRRLPLAALGTTSAINGWALVRKI